MYNESRVCDFALTRDMTSFIHFEPLTDFNMKSVVTCTQKHSFILFLFCFTTQEQLFGGAMKLFLILTLSSGLTFH